MTPSTFLFVESNTTGTGRLFARAARELGFVPVMFAVDPDRYRFAHEEHLRVEQVDTSRLDSVLARARDVAGDAAAGVFSSSDYFAATAAAVAERMGRSHADVESVRRAQDKAQQYECLQRNGVPVPKFAGARDRHALAAAVEEVGLPAVLKPHRGSGSVGVRRCDTQADAETHGRQLLTQRQNERGVAIDPAVLVTCYVAGAEYSVEMFSGTPIGITKKHLSPEPLFVEMGHDFPAPLSSAEARRIEEIARRAVLALGLIWGPVHVELRLTARGPVVIEVNGRLAGGFIPELVRLATGVDLIAQAVRLASGCAVTLAPTRRQAASIRFVTMDRSGILQGLAALDAVLELPGVVDASWYRAAGEQFSPRGDFRDRIGHVIACADTSEIAGARADTALAALSSGLHPVEAALTGN